MRKLAVAFLFVTLPCLAANPDPDPCRKGYAYVGPMAPANWGTLPNRPASWRTCSTGMTQSPIILMGGPFDGRLPVVEILNGEQQSTFRVEDTGHNLKVENVSPPWRLKWGARVAVLDEFHVHVRSEHYMDGQQAPAEIHFVFKDERAQDALIVLAVLVTNTGSNDALQTVVNNKPASCGFKQSTDRIRFTDFLPANITSYYTYHGSLTTPPCSENVDFIIPNALTHATPGQLSLLVRTPPGNARPPQLYGVRRRR